LTALASFVTSRRGKWVVLAIWIVATFALFPLGSKTPTNARFDASYAQVDLARFAEDAGLRGIQFAGLATGRLDQLQRAVDVRAGIGVEADVVGARFREPECDGAANPGVGASDESGAVHAGHAAPAATVQPELQRT